MIKKSFHLENRVVVITKDSAVQIVRCTTNSIGPANDEDLK